MNYLTNVQIGGSDGDFTARATYDADAEARLRVSWRGDFSVTVRGAASEGEGAASVVAPAGYGQVAVLRLHIEATGAEASCALVFSLVGTGRQVVRVVQVEP
ncbi:MAG: hypothetical protein KC620_06450 [Myxococcales bacterium]|nr:hypothetical protein [Myxococcales bacterium]